MVVDEYPLTWRTPKIPLYKEDTGSEDHLHAFKTNMADRAGRKDIWRRIFRRALTVDVIAWYKTLPEGAIHTYEDLEKAFWAAFTHHRRMSKFMATLMDVGQGDFESTCEYMDRFASEVQGI